MKFIVCVTFLFLCTSGFSRSKAVDKSEKKGKADGQKRVMETPQVVNCIDDCYLKYFARGVAPTGLDHSISPARSCICQKDDKGNVYFATHFYDNAGIAAYSAYVIQASDAQWIGSNKRVYTSWRMTPGITKQGSDALYKGSSKKKINRGHLNPSLINSYDCNHQIATFTYTNAIPQFESHNKGGWKKYEGEIANYVKHRCGHVKGNMYLITGTSNYIYDRKTQKKFAGAKIIFPSPSDPSGIVRPNSLWTAGCCVVPETGEAQSIAVWGNNNEDDPYTMSLLVPDLEELLGTSTFPPARLFPALPECRKNSILILKT